MCACPHYSDRVSDQPSDADLTGLLDEARRSQAASSRTTERWLRQQAFEEARLTGVLRNAAERHDIVTVRTSSGRSHTGQVRLIGGDFCLVETAGGERVYIRTDAITVVQPDRRSAAGPASDDRGGTVDTTLVEELADQAGEEPDAVFVCAGSPDALTGRLIAVGMDLATLEVDQQRRVAYVALASVTEAWLRSG